MFRSIFDHPQGDIFSFTSVTKDKIVWFVVACLLYLCFVLMLLRAHPSLVVAVHLFPRSSFIFLEISFVNIIMAVDNRMVTVAAVVIVIITCLVFHKFLDWKSKYTLLY